MMERADLVPQEARADLVLQEALKRKPKHGTPCNGCGACCMVTRCGLAQHVFSLGEFGRCPALTQTSATTYGCGLVLDPRKYVPARAASKGVAALRRAAAVLIGAGNGCDAGFTGEWRDKAYDAALEARGRSAEYVKARRRANLLWGSSK
jgi:hypothetical protein